MNSKKLLAVSLASAMVIPTTVVSDAAARETIIVPSNCYNTHEELIGKNRYETGVLAAEKSGKSKNLILVNGKPEKMVDGLCASALIDKFDATVLPVNPEHVSESAKELINNAENVYIIGMYEAMPKAFEDGISENVNVKRIGGSNRFETSKEIAKELSSYNQAYLVNGNIGEADAMSMSSVAAKKSEPILLVKGDSATITKNERVKYTAIGGEQVISSELENKFSADRIAGKDRYETNRKVIEKFYPQSSKRYFTNGETLIDALSAASISKGDGITFVNKGKNIDMLEYINTVQIGGIFHGITPIDIVFKCNDSNKPVAPDAGGGVKPEPPKPPVVVNDAYLKNVEFATESSEKFKNAVSVVFDVNQDLSAIKEETVNIKNKGTQRDILAYIDSENVLHVVTDAEKMIVPESCANMFKNMTRVKSIDMSKADTTQLKNMSGMFEGCPELTDSEMEKVLTGINTENVTDMGRLFKGCSGLKAIDLSKLNTTGVTNMSGIFEGCSGLDRTLDLSKLNTSKVTDMSNMFKNCTGFTELDLTGINTENVTNMSGMFEGCSNVVNFDEDGDPALNEDGSESKGFVLSGFNTSKVTDMSNMFKDCTKTEELDLTSFDINNVTNMKNMFYNCAKYGLGMLAVYAEDEDTRDRVKELYEYDDSKGENVIITGPEI